MAKWQRIALVALVGVLVLGAAVWAARPQVEAGVAGPEDVVKRFYDWYLDYVSGEERANALRDKAYMDSPYLTEEWKAQVEETVAGFTMGGFDPFLCAQDVPVSMHAVSSAVSGDEATVTVETSFEGHSILVDLERTDGNWLISGVRPNR